MANYDNEAIFLFLYNKKINNMEQPTDAFIPDGMNAFQRNVKRIGDCLIAFIALIIFSPLFLYCYIAQYSVNSYVID